MYTIREWEVENNEDLKEVHHVWFLVKSLEEAENIIVKRVFGRKPYRHVPWHSEKRWDYDTLSLFKINKMMYDLDVNIGPETVVKYIITEED